MITPADAVTALFVPGDRPDRFARAAAAGPDLVIIDLEDAVPRAAKADALAATLAALAPDGELRALVRIDVPGSGTFDTEVAELQDLAGRPGHGLLGLVLPKADDPAVLRALAVGPARPALIPLVESARGVVRAAALAEAEGVSRLAFGALDFALDVDVAPAGPTADHARAQLVLASRAAGRAAPLDSPSTEISDLAAVGAAARSARALGFGGKLCIHPSQLVAVRTAFAPTADEVAWARSVVGAGEAAVQVAGQMVDRPLLERARRILARAGDQPGR
jgi:citrate lyase subunit beta / citryl-CoA lyase